MDTAQPPARAELTADSSRPARARTWGEAPASPRPTRADQEGRVTPGRAAEAFRDLRRQLLDARDARAAAITRMTGVLPPEHALVFLSLNLPGPVKNDARLDPLFRRTLKATLTNLRGARLVDQGSDAAGPWAAVSCAETPTSAKRRAVEMEERTAAGRLVDLDVFGADGRQADRRSLGLPPRPCLACTEAAADCIRIGRHTASELAAAVDRLLRADECRLLAAALVEGARSELDLTPKPGLVDRCDNGSHPDLSFELMSRSIDLLPEYYDDLLLIAGWPSTPLEPGRPCSTVVDTPSCLPARDVLNGRKPCSCVERHRGPSRRPSPAAGGASRQRCLARRALDRSSVLDGLGRATLDLIACIQAARRAEQRMIAAIGTNAHRGYIFLSGLLLLACAEGRMREARGGEDTGGALRPLSSGCHPHVLQRSVSEMAGRVLEALRSDVVRTHGADVRARLGAGGIHAEALAGLPSVFEHGLPVLDVAHVRFNSAEAAHHYLLASLMTRVEDTTALHRCGPEGLERLRRDGRAVMAAMDGGHDYLGLLATLNEEYRATRLTMGGVADCLAITIGLRLAAG